MAEVLPFYVVIAAGIPETIVFLLLGFQLFNDQISIKQTLIISFVGSVVNYYIRALNVVFGIHTVVTLITLILICYLITKKDIWKISSAIVCGTVIFLFVEWLFLYILRIYDADLSHLALVKPWLNIVLALPPTVFVGLLYWFTNKKNLHLFNDASMK